MSQGGGFALAIAALDRRIRAASSEVAWPLHFRVSAQIETAPYGELCTYLREHPDRADAIMENLEYFDAYNLVRNITCPVLVNAVVIDRGPSLPHDHAGVRADPEHEIRDRVSGHRARHAARTSPATP